MEGRETTLEEDLAYSLFGIFDVCLPLLYGEGEERAMRRLREAVVPPRHSLVDEDESTPEPLSKRQKISPNTRTSLDYDQKQVLLVSLTFK